MFCRVRVQQLYDIIEAFPASMPAVIDIRAALRRVCMSGRRRQLAESLIRSMQERLLHAGMATEDVLRFLVGATKALRTVDSTGVVLEVASAPVKQVLCLAPTVCLPADAPDTLLGVAAAVGLVWCVDASTCAHARTPSGASSGASPRTTRVTCTRS